MTTCKKLTLLHKQPCSLKWLMLLIVLYCCAHTEWQSCILVCIFTIFVDISDRSGKLHVLVLGMDTAHGASSPTFNQPLPHCIGKKCAFAFCAGLYYDPEICWCVSIHTYLVRVSKLNVGISRSCAVPHTSCSCCSLCMMGELLAVSSHSSSQGGLEQVSVLQASLAERRVGDLGLITFSVVLELGWQSRLSSVMFVDM